MKTYIPKKEEVQANAKWYIIDATGKTPGHMATMIADKLRGKDKPIFSPHMDCGDFVIVVNAEKVKFTGSKEDIKVYHSHSGYPGGYKARTAGEMLEKNPTKVIELAVKGMLPKNRLRSNFLAKLKVYVGADHPHAAQQPETLEV